MHRHGYRGTKFGRQRDQRRALLKSLADALVLREAIETTLSKAKEVARYTEKLITKAKQADLHNRRQVISGLATLEAAHKLVDEISPKLSARNSGYFKVVRTDSRRGDNTQMARVSFVDDLKGKKPAKKSEPAEAAKKKEADAAKAVSKTAEIPLQAPPQTATKIQADKTSHQVAKRTGRRGNR